MMMIKMAPVYTILPKVFAHLPLHMNLISIQFSFIYSIYRQITTNVISRHLNNIVQFKPIGVQFIVIIIQ